MTNVETMLAIWKHYDVPPLMAGGEVCPPPHPSMVADEDILKGEEVK